MDNKETFGSWLSSKASDVKDDLDMTRYLVRNECALREGWQACAEQKDKEIEFLEKALEVSIKDTKYFSEELKNLKDEINRVWYLAYPESPQTDKDVAKMRVFNLYQDLVCTRDNYRFLNNAWNKLNEEVKK